jgi:hypothetical protein
MAKTPKERLFPPEQRAIWTVRDAKHMFGNSAMSLEELKTAARVSRKTAHSVVWSEPVKRLMAVRVFQVLNAHTGGLRSEETHVVSIEFSNSERGVSK